MAGSPVYTDGTKTTQCSNIKINVGGTWKTPNTTNSSNAGIGVNVSNTWKTISK